MGKGFPETRTQNPYVQIEGGLLADVSLGLVPMGGVGQQLADAGELLPHGTPEARLGLSVGMIVGGIAITAGAWRVGCSAVLRPRRGPARRSVCRRWWCRQPLLSAERGTSRPGFGG